MTLSEYQNFATEKINWLERRFTPIIQKKLFKNDLHKRVQELWRSCKILQRSINLLIAQGEIFEHELEDVNALYLRLKNIDIPNFLVWYEIIGEKTK